MTPNHSQSPTAKFGVASVAGVDSLEAASTSPHVGGPWVTAVASSMRAVPSLVSALGRQSSSFQRVPALPNPGKDL